MRILFDWVLTTIKQDDQEKELYFTVVEDGTQLYVAVMDHHSIPIGTIRFPNVEPGLLQVEQRGEQTVQDYCKSVIAQWVGWRR